jgi:hypothetical protein
MLLSMALCHILPEAEGMYQALKLIQEKEAEGLMVHDEDDHGEEHEGEEHSEDEEEHSDEEEEHSDEEEEHSDEEHEGEEHEGEEHEGEEHEEHEKEGGHGFPLVYVLFFGGFMIMLSLDQVVFKTT